MARRGFAGPVTAYIAGEFRAQKARHGWTFDQIAERTDLGRSTVERSLKGDVDLIVEAFVQVARALGLDPAALLRDAVRHAQSPARADYDLAAHTTDEQTDLERFNKAHDDEPA